MSAEDQQQFLRNMLGRRLPDGEHARRFKRHDSCDAVTSPATKKGYCEAYIKRRTVHTPHIYPSASSGASGHIYTHERAHANICVQHTHTHVCGFRLVLFQAAAQVYGVAYHQEPLEPPGEKHQTMLTRNGNLVSPRRHVPPRLNTCLGETYKLELALLPARPPACACLKCR